MNSERKGLHPFIVACMSAIIWGTGQIVNKQYIKGFILFSVQCIFFGAEILTGNYFTGNFIIREHGGFFIKGIWGLITLGTQSRQMTLAGLTKGDHSIVLMISGIIALLILIIFIAMYCFNVSDAYKTRKKYYVTGELLLTKAYLTKLWHSMFHFVVLLPAIFLLIFLVLMPILFSLLVAFTNYTKANMPPANLVQWIGFSNFKSIFTHSAWSRTFVGVFRWTIIWAVMSTATCFFGGFFQAVLINHKKVKAKPLWRGILILPWAIPAFISLLVFKTMFNGQFGPISQFLMNIGLTQTRVAWLTDAGNPNLARGVLLLVNLWLGFPYFMALMSGVLTGISTEYYEAARIDGATPSQEFFKITFPLVMKSTAPLLIMSFSSNFNNFGVIYFFTEGGPINPNYQFAGYTDLLISWIYKLTLDQQLYSIASVMSILIFMIVGSIAVVNFRRTKAFKEM